MTLFNFDDDQLVPQGNLAGLQKDQPLSFAPPLPQLPQAQQARASDTETAVDAASREVVVDALNTPTLLRPIPDFESLLTDLTDGCASWSDPDPVDLMYPMTDTAATDAAYRALSEPTPEQELTLYDDQPAGMHIKQEKPFIDDYSTSTSTTAPARSPLQQQSPHHLAPHHHHQHQQQQQVIGVVSPQHHSLPAEEEPSRRCQLSDESQNDIDAVTREIDSVCNLLTIPVSPYQWTVEQVTKWATWTLEQYNLPVCYLYDLKIDGTTLCLLTAEDFKTRWPHFGEYLYAQLEVWKGAYYNIKAEASPTDVYDEGPTYVNLEPATTHNTAGNSDPHAMSAAAAAGHHHPHHHQQQQQQHPHHQQQQHQQHHLQQQQQQQQQQQPQQQPQPAYIPLTQSLTSPSPSPCQSMCGADLMMSSMTAIPKPVLAGSVGSLGVCGSNLSPASSIDSMDSFASSPASEADYTGSTAMQQEPRSEVTPSKQNIHLWQFLRELLVQQHTYGSAIRWLDRSKGIFKIEDSARVARLWGQRKNRPAMNYDKLSRSIRQYYKKGIIKKTDNSKRLVYQFCPQYRV